MISHLQFSNVKRDRFLMTTDGTENLVARWRKGDEAAAAELFRLYANRLIGLARSRLSGKLAQRVDPEDVVQSVYRSFFAGARDGRYDLQHGSDLWHLLVTITLNKLQHQVKRNTAEKRTVEREQNFGSEDSLLGVHPQGFAREPAPVEAVALTEELEQIMRRLPPVYRRVFELRLQGYNLDEITADTRRSERSVYRILEEIKQQLSQWHRESSGS